MTGTETSEKAAESPETGTEVETVKDAQVVPLTQAQLVSWLQAEDIEDDDSTDELAYEMAVRILNATDQDAVLAQDDVRPVAGLVGEGFVVRSVVWRKSTKSEDGKGRYAIMQCVDGDGAAFMTSCGATKVVLQLRKAEVAGWFPWHVELNQETTSNNRTVYELVAPEPF